MGKKMSREEFVSLATNLWRDRFPLVTEFMDWVKDNGYWELDKVRDLRPVQKRYVENMLKGKDERGKVRKDSEGRGIYVWGMIGIPERHMPNEMYLKFYENVRGLVGRQFKKRMLEPKFMITGIGGISQCALMSILGVNSITYTTRTDQRVVRFKRYANSMPKNPNEMTSFSLVEPMVRIVEAILSNPNVTEEELDDILSETSLEKAKITDFTLTCTSCNTTESYDAVAVRAFGSVRCKSCGFQIPAPKE